MMTRLIPNIFYSSLSDGLDLFVTCLGFKVLHQDATLAGGETEGRAGVRRPRQDRRLRGVPAVLTVEDSGRDRLGQQAVELSGIVERLQFVETADNLAVDKNLGK